MKERRGNYGNLIVDGRIIKDLTEVVKMWTILKWFSIGSTGWLWKHLVIFQVHKRHEICWRAGCQPIRCYWHIVFRMPEGYVKT